MTEEIFPIRQLAAVVRPLLAWYEVCGRKLPWREGKNPYQIWISEIMLQQTRIEAVKPYYERFLQELPDVASLAAVPEDRLLKLWEGLGYYSRARNLKKAAVQLCQKHGAQLPADYAALKSLPGIGPYTAGAIASIAFSIPVPAVDGNVLRVLSRLCENEEDITGTGVKKAAEAALQAILPAELPGAFNEALMELGETICIPNGAPLCELCPLAEHCLARKAGREATLPLRAEKRARRREEKTILLFRGGGWIAIQKRPGKGLLAGMYELPSLEGKKSEESVRALLYGEQMCAQPAELKALGETKHIFSHVEWHMTGYEIREAGDKAPDLSRLGGLFPELFLATEEELQSEYALPGAFSFYTGRRSG